MSLVTKTEMERKDNARMLNKRIINIIVILLVTTTGGL